jgi:multiple sugar transport system permease protein
MNTPQVAEMPNTPVAAGSRRTKRITLVQRDAFYGYLFVLPQVIGFLLFVLGPLMAVFAFSLQDRNLLSDRASFVGLGNYQQMIADPLFAKVLANSLIFMTGLVPLNLGISLTLALLLARSSRRVSLFRSVIFLPVVTSAVAWAIVWNFILQGEQGALNQVLALVGIRGPNWLGDPTWAMVSVIVVRVLKNVGLNVVIFVAALQDLPRDTVEAAEVDGATRWQSTRYIIIPFLAPSIMFVTIITVIGSLNVFDHIMLLTGGGPSNATMVLAFYVYHAAFRMYEIGYASTLAVVLFLLALLLTIVQWVLRRRFVYSEN